MPSPGVFHASNPAAMVTLDIRDLGKRYYTGAPRDPGAASGGSRDDGQRRLRWPTFARGTNRQELWALRHVSFEVPSGAIVGVVGPNGAGKSTLLKIIARVTTPTEGRVVGRGRVASLIELGAGFNPDFSARENIFMNAAMHGIPRQEVQRRLPEIVEFAEVDRFLDSPLRHFSSGMYVRLAFSVAINLRPTILLADEILAVGDTAFQERCLRRVEQEAQSGLSVLFVSHDLQAVTRLCHQALWLNGGRTVQFGPAGDVVRAYEHEALARPSTGTGSAANARPSSAKSAVDVESVQLLATDGRVIGAAPIAEDTVVRIRLRALRPGVKLTCRLDLHTRGTLVLRSAPLEPLEVDERAVWDLRVTIPARLLAEATYRVSIHVAATNGKRATVDVPNALEFLAFGSDRAGVYKGGVIAPELEWQAQSTAVDDTLDTAVERGLGMLQRGSLTEKEVSDRLVKRGFSEAMTARAVDILRDRGALDDRRVAFEYVSRKSTDENIPRLLIEKLLARGVAKEVAEAVVSQAFDGVVDEATLLEKAVASRLPAGTLDDPRHFAKVYRVLVRQGFRPQAVEAALRTRFEGPFSATLVASGD